MGAVFIFLPSRVYIIFFSLYGTLTIPEIVGLQSPFQIASIEDVSTIVTGRMGKSDIKELDNEYIAFHIREFVFYLIDTQRAGFMRIFSPSNCPEVIEMGSFVKLIHQKGICTAMTSEVEKIGEILRKTVIAITQPQKSTGKDLASHLQRTDWEIATDSPKYKNRMQESPGKILWQKSPKRLDPDSRKSKLSQDPKVSHISAQELG